MFGKIAVCVWTCFVVLFTLLSVDKFVSPKKFEDGTQFSVSETEIFEIEEGKEATASFSSKGPFVFLQDDEIIVSHSVASGYTAEVMGASGKWVAFKTTSAVFIKVEGAKSSTYPVDGDFLRLSIAMTAILIWYLGMVYLAHLFTSK